MLPVLAVLGMAALVAGLVAGAVSGHRGRGPLLALPPPVGRPLPPRPIAPAGAGWAIDPGERLRRSVGHLRHVAPELSADRTLSDGQRRTIVGAAVVILIGLLVATIPTLVGLTGLLTLVYFANLVFRFRLFRLSLRNPAVMLVEDWEAAAVPDDGLPTYTVLVPAFRENEAVLGRLLDSLDGLDYPRHLLDVKLLLEEDDAQTLAAATAAGAGAGGRAEVVLVPTSEPRTKPKALNYGLAEAKGQLVTIYDAEDRPESLQLRRAAVALAAAPPTLACVQAELSYFNPNQNMITRWFTVEYLMWFSQFLPGLSSLDAPVPLGGTSCHFRRAVLVEVGGWDPHNVTEDADLGIRLHRLGYRTGVLGSFTYEEANSDFVNWVKQRSRWYKGYLQTWLVHMRRPRQLRRELGTGGFVRFNLFVGGTPLLALLNPVFWTLTLFWFLARPALIEAIFPGPIFHLGLFCWLVGNFFVTYAFMFTALRNDRPGLVAAAVMAPVYWLMMSMAAIKAVIQLVRAPSFWEKTSHGLDTQARTGRPAAP